MFEELRTNAEAIQAFSRTQTARTKATLSDDAYHVDVLRAEATLADARSLGGLVQRGQWLYTFRQTAQNPRGVMQRRARDAAVTHDTGWETVFDLDAYCAATGDDWHWRGAPTCPGHPNRVMIALSQGGSDQRVAREYDCDAGAFVPDGFSFGPERGHVAWLDIDTLLWSSAATPDDATDSSWPGVVRRVVRGVPMSEAPDMFRAERTDLMAIGYAVQAPDGTRLACVKRMLDIGGQQATLLTNSGPITLPTPADTEVVHTATHYAYVVKVAGGPVGALMLGEVGGAAARPVMTPGPRQAIGGQGVLLLQNWALWVLKDNLTPRLFALDLKEPKAAPTEIALPEAAQSVSFGFHNALHDDDETLQLNLQGFLVSPRIYTFDLDSGPMGVVFNLIWSDPEQFDTSGLKVQLLDATSDDGTQVPYHLVMPEDAPKDVPVLLYGYGGFNVSLAPSYNALLGALWLEKGHAYALAHIRGGGEFGPEWHKSAQRENRPRAFEDFAAIATDLVRRGVTVPARVACNGGSNGGLLTGVMLNRYPERFGAVWTKVGVHDMLGFHHFPAGRAWIDEYGDPDDPEAAAYLRAYSPLQNVDQASDRLYPPCFVETSDFDDRVDPSHSRRFAAALDAAGQPMFYAEHKGGHGGSSSALDRARNAALGYGFLRHAMGITG